PTNHPPPPTPPTAYECPMQTSTIQGECYSEFCPPQSQPGAQSRATTPASERASFEGSKTGRSLQAEHTPWRGTAQRPSRYLPTVTPDPTSHPPTFGEMNATSGECATPRHGGSV
ncbi:unnamed protein product, partial [Ixodes pacificus]